MRVVIFGAGAVGSLFAARFAGAGEDVVAVGRDAHVRRVEASGLRVEGRTEGVFRPTGVTELAPATTADLVLLTVKSRSVRDAGEALARALARPVPVVALQNGLGVEQILSEGLRAGGWQDPEGWILRGTNSYGATLLGPGEVRHAGDGEVLLPDTDGRLPAGTVDRVEQLFLRSGLRARRVPDLARELWRKALVNAAINPVTADHGVQNGELLREPFRGESEGLLREAQAVAAAEGFPFADAEADRALWEVVRSTAQNRSSMLQDLERGRPTEIDAISGALLRAGREHRLDLPLTRRAVARIRARERSGRRARTRARPAA